MKKGSLEKTISDMVRRLEAARASDTNGDSMSASPAGSDCPLKDIEAFMPVDPVLASLHKEYLEANANHKKLARQNGFNDPMTEIAADMLDSARSAMQTRLIELQESRELEVQEALVRRLRARKAEQEASQVRARIAKRAKDKENDTLFWFSVLCWLMDRTLIATQKTLSAANDFALVAVVSGKEVAAA
ncbi:MAG: hypothetical protein H6867_04295 [Rhodospirillales bacterium]|nr:hypothetical protein [Rhodospirillales bacterium]MCB9996370.1 hypothetical protein [Rhodospirillales bacterium]